MNLNRRGFLKFTAGGIALANAPILVNAAVLDAPVPATEFAVQYITVPPFDMSKAGFIIDSMTSEQFGQWTTWRMLAKLRDKHELTKLIINVSDSARDVPIEAVDDFDLSRAESARIGIEQVKLLRMDPYYSPPDWDEFEQNKET